MSQSDNQSEQKSSGNAKSKAKAEPRILPLPTEDDLPDLSDLSESDVAKINYIADARWTGNLPDSNAFIKHLDKFLRDTLSSIRARGLAVSKGDQKTKSSPVKKAATLFVDAERAKIRNEDEKNTIKADAATKMAKERWEALSDDDKAPWEEKHAELLQERQEQEDAKTTDSIALLMSIEALIKERVDHLISIHGKPGSMKRTGENRKRFGLSRLEWPVDDGKPLLKSSSSNDENGEDESGKKGKKGKRQKRA